MDLADRNTVKIFSSAWLLRAEKMARMPERWVDIINSHSARHLRHHRRSQCGPIGAGQLSCIRRQLALDYRHPALSLEAFDSNRINAW